MSMSYEYLEDFATGDIAFRAKGADLGGLFKACGDATMNVMVENLGEIAHVKSVSVKLENQDLEMLLFDFLQEFIFHKDKDQLLLRPTSVQVDKFPDGFHLTAKLDGEYLDPQRHHQRVDVKAVTLHEFIIEPTHQGWMAQIILDI